MKKSMYVKFGLDIIMAFVFVLFFNKRVLGGLAFHEIAGIAIAAVFFTHVLLNWSWVKKVTVRLFDRNLPFKTKLGYFLNVLLLISMAFIIISGILVSKVVFPNIDIGNDRWFEMSHITISFLVLILVAIHVGLHWNWIMNVFKKVFSIKASKTIVSLLVKFATVAILVFGGYQMFSSNFIMHFKGFQPYLPYLHRNSMKASMEKRVCLKERNSEVIPSMGRKKGWMVNSIDMGSQMVRVASK